MGLNEQIAKVFKDLGELGNSQERAALERKACACNSVEDWKREHVLKAASSGALTGMIGGPIGLAAIPADLAWCGRVSSHGCFGIGLIRDRDVDYDYDMNLILAIWSGVAESASVVPAGKLAIKVGGGKMMIKASGIVAGALVSKASLKGGSKLGAKLAAKAASKAAAKVTAKLASKSTAFIPIIGGLISGGVNWWLVSGLLDAADKFYDHDYVVITDHEVASEV